jgi:hypothetical protein
MNQLRALRTFPFAASVRCTAWLSRIDLDKVSLSALEVQNAIAPPPEIDSRCHENP